MFPCLLTEVAMAATASISAITQHGRTAIAAELNKRGARTTGLETRSNRNVPAARAIGRGQPGQARSAFLAVEPTPPARLIARRPGVPGIHERPYEECHCVFFVGSFAAEQSVQSLLVSPALRRDVLRHSLARTGRRRQPLGAVMRRLAQRQQHATILAA